MMEAGEETVTKMNCYQVPIYQQFLTVTNYSYTYKEAVHDDWIKHSIKQSPHKQLLIRQLPVTQTNILKLWQKNIHTINF